jgi:hypothetical protein
MAGAADLRNSVAIGSNQLSKSFSSATSTGAFVVAFFTAQSPSARQRRFALLREGRVPWIYPCLATFAQPFLPKTERYAAHNQKILRD